MERKHTPLPFTVSWNNENNEWPGIEAIGYCSIVIWGSREKFDDDGGIRGGDGGDDLNEAVENAKFLCRAANNHYPLLEACKKLTAALEVHGSIPVRAELIQAAWEEAVKAIADAEKEER